MKKCEQIPKYNKKMIDNFSPEIPILEKLKNNVHYYFSITSFNCSLNFSFFQYNRADQQSNEYHIANREILRINNIQFDR